GGYLGSVEESFIGKLKKGDAFLFGGRLLELANTRDMTAYVRVSKKRNRIVPRWQGGRIPLSTELAEILRRLLAGHSDLGDSPEMKSLAPLLELQAAWSELPREDALLVEKTRTREGWHLYFFPFAGRSAHEGIGNLIALRLSRLQEATFHVTANDYGFEVFSKQEVFVDEERVRNWFSGDNWQRDLLEGVNEAELSKRQFRDIARIAGLIFPGFPGKGKSTRQLQASSELIFEVLKKYDSENELLAQSQREVMDRQIDQGRIASALESIPRGSILIRETDRLTPLAFPLWAERIRAQTLSSETWETRVRGMAEQLNQAAGRSRVYV
ncbi:MAG: DNA ligase-associated DEXH box helicase, partial [Verrucomicrobiota bacterium]